MADRGKYASHGTYIKKMNQNFLGNWSKPKLAVINPEPSTVPRSNNSSKQTPSMAVQSTSFNTKFRFQEPVVAKPVTSELIQPFLYIQKVMNKNKQAKDHAKSKLQPFITSKVVNKKRPASTSSNTAEAPAGYANLFDFETDKKNTANSLFQKLLEANIENVKGLHAAWSKNSKHGPDINIGQQEFVDFIQELIPSRISNKHIRHFFELYCNQAPKKSAEDVGRITQPKQISIRAFSYNFDKYRKAETEITNIMSQKAMKDRYVDLKKYLSDYLRDYPELKLAMKGIKQYEETLRDHFHRTYEAYVNPFAEQVADLREQLEKPIVKYDKEKKEALERKIEGLQEENNKIHSKLTEDFNDFMEAYESAIVKNHDLCFTKRTVARLLWPIIERSPYLTRELIEEQVGIRQDEKQRYLESLSEIIVQIDNDKKHVMEDCFTLGDMVELVRMKYRMRGDQSEEKETIENLKKLIKEVKRQFLKRNNLLVEDFDSFPADQEIPLEILHTCFEMECTKVLFKNQIWSELLMMLPERSVLSRLHQLKIDANTCMEYLHKYFKKLDERSTLELNKSKEVSLMAENAYNENFGQYAQIIHKVMMGVDCYVEGEEEDSKQREELGKKKKKVGFADIVDSKLKVERGEKHDLEEDETDNIAKNMIKMIHQGGIAQGIADLGASLVSNQAGLTNRSLFASLIQPTRAEESEHHRNMEPIPENLHLLKTLARSYFEPEALNTNAFDIRFYEKINEEQKKNEDPLANQQLVSLGTSMLLMNAPRPSEIEGREGDPLRISRFLLKTIDEEVKEQQKEVKLKEYDSDIREGVSSNYYREKIKLENKPTRFDSEGRSKYSVMMPVGYYESYIVGENVPDKQKWYLRPHHVETLTENPLSKKDNVIHTEYQSKLDKLGLKKRPDEFVIEENVKRKQDLIGALEDRIQSLKGEVSKARRSSEISGFKVPTTLVNDYMNKMTDNKEDKELEMGVYEGMLYDLRRKERELLNQHREHQTKMHGEPNPKWWERKDKEFNREVRKDRELVGDRHGVHRSYVEKLKNNEIY